MSAVLFALGPLHFESGQATLGQTALKAFFPLAAYLALAPVLWVFFGRTWRELDLVAHEHQKKTLASGGYNFRPAVLFVITALVLTLQEYYGGRDFFEEHFKPWLQGIELGQLMAPGGLGRFVDTRKYGELYSFAWWAFNRVLRATRSSRWWRGS